MTEKENTQNMMRCPRWNECNIPKCPLDYDMDLRFEDREDEVCPLRRITEAYPRRGKVKTILSAKMRSLLEFVPAKNKRMAKTA
jgi:hypothetical protein